MQEWINSVLSTEQAGFTVFGAVFLLGIISVFTCACNYAVIGTVAGYTGSVSASGKAKSVLLISVFFLLGTVVSMSALGSVIGYAGEYISLSIGNYWKIVAGIVSILFGLYTIDMIPFKIPGISINYQNKKTSLANAVLFGFIVGGITSLSSLCCNPFFPVIMAASFVKGSTVWGFLMLLTYSAGYGITLSAAMVGMGFGLGKISGSLSLFAKFLKYAGGITLIIIGFYFLFTI
jgi:cytochrome c biogenesis protein CcdA